MATAGHPADAGSDHPVVVPLRAGGEHPPFFLVAGGVGGEAELLVYARLARFHEPGLPFYGLRARGVDDLVDPHRTVEEMAAEHLREIRKVQARGPYFVGGSCMGGMVAFELARQLRAHGDEVALLVLIDSPFPTPFRLVLNRLVNYSRSVREHGVRAVLRPTDAQRVGRRKVAIGNRYFGRMLRYRPQPYDRKLTLIACADRRDEDPARVWRDVATGGLEVHEIPGNHYTHLREHAATTAACLDGCLRRARSEHSGTPPGLVAPASEGAGS